VGLLSAGGSLGTLSASFGYTLGRDDRAAYLHKQQQIQQTRQNNKIIA